MEEKILKKKLIALVLSLCLLFSVFTGCSLIKKDPVYADDTVIATLYGQNITYSDLKAKYQKYSQYFAVGLSEDVVMRFIYDELYLEALEKANANDIIVLTNSEVKEVLKDLYHEYVHLANTKEEALLNHYGKEIPERISEHSDSDTSSSTTNPVYEEYIFEPATPIDYSGVDDAGDINIRSKVDYLRNEVYEDVTEEEKEIRDEAWDMVLADLVYSYKMSGTTLTKEEALIKSMQERYSELKLAKVLEKYQKYVESRVFGDKTFEEQIEDADVASKIVSKYKELISANRLNASSKDAYTSLVLSTKNEDMLLYHYYDDEMEAENVKYFSVLHILISFDSDTKTELEQYPGATSTKDAMFREEYETARMAKAWDGTKWIVSSTYRDAKGNTVQTEKRDSNNEIVYEVDENNEYVLDSNGNKIAVKVDQTITMQEVYNKFESEWSRIQSNNPAMSDTEKAHLRTQLFRKYMYLYTDSQEYKNLSSSTVANYMGYTVSNEDGENSGLMQEFADTAKELFAHYESGMYDIGEEIGFAVTSYGVHMMIINNVYTPGEIVSLTKTVGTETVEKTDAEIIEEMSNTILSYYKGQTLLQYVYEAVVESELKNFFTDSVYAMLDEAERTGQFVKFKTPTYDDLKKY